MAAPLSVSEVLGHTARSRDETDTDLAIDIEHTDSLDDKVLAIDLDLAKKEQEREQEMEMGMEMEMEMGLQRVQLSSRSYI